MKDKAVALMYYGFPESRDEMRDYLKHILHGKEPPLSLIRENLEKLDIIGGRTPSIEIVSSIHSKVSDRLSGEGYNTYLLTKHYKPSISDASRMISEGEIYEVPLFPVYSKFIFDGYFGPFESQFRGRKLVRITNIGFDEGMIAHFKSNVMNIPGSIPAFSAHSIPIEGYDPYENQILDLSLRISGGRDHINIYHSQGPFHSNWLTPYPEFSVQYAKDKGYSEIEIIPIGFIYDHIEVLYDLDYKLRNYASERGIGYRRIPLPNDSKPLIDAITKLIVGKY